MSKNLKPSDKLRVRDVVNMLHGRGAAQLVEYKHAWKLPFNKVAAQLVRDFAVLVDMEGESVQAVHERALAEKNIVRTSKDFTRVKDWASARAYLAECKAIHDQWAADIASGRISKDTQRIGGDAAWHRRTSKEYADIIALIDALPCSDGRCRANTSAPGHSEGG